MSEKQNKKNRYEEKNITGSLGPIEPPKIYGHNSVRSENKRNIRAGNQKRALQNKKRKLKNGVRKAIISFVLILVLLAAGIILSLTVFFKTEVISVSGSGIYSDEEIKSASDIKAGENLILLNSDSIKDLISTELPYIYSVSVKKVLPKTVKITVTDATAAYSIENEDKTFILLDDNFKVLENQSAENPAQTINISSTAIKSCEPGTKIVFENDASGGCLLKMAQAIKSTEITNVTSITSTDANNNYIVYDGRITFELGTCDDLENKLFRGIAACSKLDENNSGVQGTLNLTNGKQIYFTAK
ncbi:MAG: FtsQ-type POTRA domain-containing protein [Clostridiales bacterium]|nr:FtsQ-type POTRA domain-containing protein [Clostridiales bacterium]